MKDCIFCKIVAGKAPSNKFWENEKHIAFLDIFPNTPGFTIVVTKEHFPSNYLEVDSNVLKELFDASVEVSTLLEKTFSDVTRVGLMIEGTGVDHLHYKLFPMHGSLRSPQVGERENKHEPCETFFETYPGYISSHSSKRADDAELAKLAKQIRNANVKE